MSRIWDTPEFWARSEADEALRDMPDIDPAALALSFERSAASYDGEPEMVRLIAADLRRRATAGIRFWPGPQSLANAAPSGAPAGSEEFGIAELIDDEIPW